MSNSDSLERRVRNLEDGRPPCGAYLIAALLAGCIGIPMFTPVIGYSMLWWTALVRGSDSPARSSVRLLSEAYERLPPEYPEEEKSDE